MGWTGYDLPDKRAKLYTRGGLEGAFIEIELDQAKTYRAVKVEIPVRLLLMLAAEQVRSSMIGQLEQATDGQVLGLPELIDEDELEARGEGE